MRSWVRIPLPPFVVRHRTCTCTRTSTHDSEAVLSASAIALAILAALSLGIILGVWVTRRVSAPLHAEIYTALRERTAIAERRADDVGQMLDEYRAHGLGVIPPMPAALNASAADSVTLPQMFLDELDGIEDTGARQTFRENAEYILRGDPNMSPEALIQAAMGITV